MKLYHYTCQHIAEYINRDGFLKANEHPWLPEAGPIVWLTDMRHPQVAALGLTSRFISCDRTAVRYIVECDAEPWREFADRVGIAAEAREVLESRSKPHRWFVATKPVPVVPA